MNRKFLMLSSVLTIIMICVIYLGYRNLTAGGKDGKNCSNLSGCTSESYDIKADKDVLNSSELAVYEFITDKAANDDMRNSLKEELMKVKGIKDVRFGMTCTYSKVTQVTISYSADETSEETIALFVKDKNYDYTKDKNNEPKGNCPYMETKDTRKI